MEVRPAVFELTGARHHQARFEKRVPMHKVARQGVKSDSVGLAQQQAVETHAAEYLPLAENVN